MFFFSLLFCQFLIRNFLKATEIVIHSLIQRISMQIGLEMNAKKHKSHQKTISPLCTLFRFRSCETSLHYVPLKTLMVLFDQNNFRLNKTGLHMVDTWPVHPNLTLLTSRVYLDVTVRHTCDEFGTGIREIFLPFQGDF